MQPADLKSESSRRDYAGVDSSSPALELAGRNAALNGIAEDVCAFQQADVMEFMKQTAADGRQWDLVRTSPAVALPIASPHDSAIQSVRYMLDVSVTMLVIILMYFIGICCR